ncbi:putative subtilase-type serine protease [Deinococcus piscis]|uniref:Subtilase-type serine protease n=1 Tax=Deinococcus piscis TaxID=394230 RepID=A0ABQ3K3C5_9DEIO|nr:S8 family serine peptidase [Deinococcus piscis]GHF98287.1 putative subtilase-type serine protease [Deinococcus piscis]
MNHRQHFAGILGLSLLLASCGQTSTPPLHSAPGPTPTAPGQAVPELDGDRIAHQLIVGLDAGGDLNAVLTALDARLVDRNERLGAVLIEVPQGRSLEKAAGLLRGVAGVRYAEPNYVASKPVQLESQSPLGAQSVYGGLNDPEIGYQWFLRSMKAAEAWKTTTGKGIRIAVADEDIDRHHPDLAANIAYPGYDSPNNTLITPATPHDGMGQHGTWVAGTAAAVGNNGIGGAGVAPDASIVPVTITHSGTGASYWDSARAFVWSVNGPDNLAPGDAGDADTPAGRSGYVDIVNYSFGGDNYSQILREGIEYVLQHGVVFVTSAGNTPTTGSSSGAWVPGVISVAATTATDTRTTFSNRGGHLSVAAPGENIWVPGTRSRINDPSDNTYAYVNGTSFAGPATAGAAALVLAAAAEKDASGAINRVNLTPAQVRHILEDTAHSPTGGYTTDLGYGVVRADRAVDMALNDASNRVEKGASLDMRFVAQSDPSVGIPLVGVTLKGSERRPDQLLYGQSAAGAFVYPSGHTSFYEIDAGDYQLFASGPRPILTGTAPGSSVASVSLSPGERRTLGDQAGVPLAVALPADPYEPNNTPAQATAITYGQGLEAVMGERDTDLYRFSAQAGETAFIGTQTLLGSPDLKVRVLDGSGKELAVNASFRSGLRDAALAFRVPASGQYFAEITDEGVGGAFNTYLVGLTRWKGQAPEQNEAGRVTNDTFGGVDWSKALGTAVGETYEATLATNTDVDTFRLSARAGQTLVIDTLAHESGKPDLMLGLFDAQGQLLASNDDFTGQDSMVTFEVPSDGEYFVAAGSYNAESKGTYTISFMEKPGQ